MNTLLYALTEKTQEINAANEEIKRLMADKNAAYRERERLIERVESGLTEHIQSVRDLASLVTREQDLEACKGFSRYDGKRYLVYQLREIFQRYGKECPF